MFAQSPYVGNLHGRENEVGFMNYLDQKGIIQNTEGYSHSSVVRWCHKQSLQNFYIRHRFYVPKEYLLDFFTSRRFINISVKSELHKERNQQLIQYQAESRSAMVSTPQPSEKRTKNKVYTKNQGS